MLKSHPELFSLGEIFNEANDQSYFQFLQKQLVSDVRAALPSNAVLTFLNYLDWCVAFAQSRKPNAHIIVLDVKYDQSHLLCEAWWSLSALPRIFFLMKERGWKVVDIHRKNIIGLVISNQIAIKTKIYHSTTLTPGQTQSAKVYINARQLTREIAATERAYMRVAQHFCDYKKYLEVPYEEMFDDNGDFAASTLVRVAEFLGVAASGFEPKPKLAKLLKSDPLLHVENANEIRKLIAAHTRR